MSRGTEYIHGRDSIWLPSHSPEGSLSLLRSVCHLLECLTSGIRWLALAYVHEFFTRIRLLGEIIAPRFIAPCLRVRWS